MIGKKIEKAFNEQLKNEIESSYIYLSMAAWFHSAGFDGMAQWMKVQSGEEMGHAMKFFEHITARNGKVSLAAIVKPKEKWANPLEAFQEALAHEEFITGKIDELVALAAKEADNAASSFLKWFVDEQVEEEGNALKIVNLLERIGDSSQGLIMLDFKLGERK